MLYFKLLLCRLIVFINVSRNYKETLLYIRFALDSPPITILKYSLNEALPLTGANTTVNEKLIFKRYKILSVRIETA